ncbi:MAG: hypothetical protein LBC84_01665 [Prevotellaceae bacterium]|nr:hypothetical protein [Prevotellaceae bacterium]
MKQPRFLLFALLLFIVVGCTERSPKYKRLQAQLDSLQAAAVSQTAEFEEIFAIINEIEQGLKSIRETENLLQIQSVRGGEISTSAREQMKNNIQYIAATIEEYKAQIARLESENKNQSTQFQKRLKSLREELVAKERVIDDLSRQIEEKETQIIIQTQHIISMDQSIAVLKADLSELERENERQVVKIGEQDRQIYSGFYVVGEKRDLISAQVLSKGGLFRAAKISYQAEQSAFTKIDIRNVTSIPLHAKKAKVLSIHTSGTYSFDPDANGYLHLTISNPALFWEQTKYLVIKVN